MDAKDQKQTKKPNLVQLAMMDSNSISEYFGTQSKILNFYLAPSFAQVCKQEVILDGKNVQLKEFAFTILVKLIESLGELLAANFHDQKNRQKATLLANTLIRNYSTKLSLSAIADCFHKIKIGQEPCDMEMMGFDVRSICMMVSRYATEYGKQRHAIQKSLENNYTAPANTDQAEEIKTQFEEFSKNHLKKYPIPLSLEDERKNRKQIEHQQKIILNEHHQQNKRKLGADQPTRSASAQ